MQTVALARHAMATRFEILLHGENEVSLRAAGEEALNEIERLDAQLSLYNPASELSHINARAACGPVRVEPALFRLLQHAQELTRASEAAFDTTASPPGGRAWRVALPGPEFAERILAPGRAKSDGGPDSAKLLAVVSLKDEALSVSAVWGKSFESGGRVYGHVIDPRKGEPVEGAI